MSFGLPLDLLQMRQQQSIFVASGPSGAGKKALLNEVRHSAGRLIASTVSFTSRERRNDEVEGEDYFYVSRGEFERLIAEGYFLEHATIHGNYYGTPNSEVRRVQAAGCSILLEIDVVGRGNLLTNIQPELAPSVVDIFIAPPSIRELARRIRTGRNTTEEDIEKRMRTALAEMPHADKYRHIIINDDKAAATRQILRVFDFYLRPHAGSDLARAGSLIAQRAVACDFLASRFDSSYEFQFPEPVEAN